MRPPGPPNRRLLSGVLLLAVAGACTGNAPESGQAGQSPYAGLQSRDIRALAPERVSDLLAGRGAGYALAAELNHYPGPRHVLELGDQLGLTQEQRNEIDGIKLRMSEEAKRLGHELVELERELDRAFRSGQITRTQLTRLTAAIAEVEGRVRNTHLEAHLATKSVLSPHQVMRYDQLRGYREQNGQHEGGEHTHSEGDAGDAA